MDSDKNIQQRKNKQNLKQKQNKSPPKKNPKQNKESKQTPTITTKHNPSLLQNHQTEKPQQNPNKQAKPNQDKRLAIKKTELVWETSAYLEQVGGGSLSCVLLKVLLICHIPSSIRIHVQGPERLRAVEELDVVWG